jgi:hypothetical protein
MENPRRPELHARFSGLEEPRIDPQMRVPLLKPHQRDRSLGSPKHKALRQPAFAMGASPHPHRTDRMDRPEIFGVRDSRGRRGESGWPKG